MTHEELISRIKTLVQRCGSQAALARKTGVTKSYLSDVILDRRTPGEKLLKALNVKKVISYERLK